MNDDRSKDFGSYAALLRRRRVWILTILPAGVLLATYLAYALTPEYRSTATIILEQGSISEGLIKSSVASTVEQEIEVLQGRVMTLDALRELVKSYDPYPDEKGLDLDAKALRIEKDTSFEKVDPVTFLPLEHSPAVSLYYQNPDPRRASIVTRKLAELFLSYHQRVREQAARATAKLIQDRADELTGELQKVDDEYGRLRNANGGTLPDVEGRGEDARYRAERDLTDLERQLRAAQEQESLFSVQLSNTSPNLMTNKGDLTDIATVKAQLADALQRYTPDHPDVKRLQRALAALQAQTTSNSSNPVANADNPDYRRIATQLLSARSEVAALQAATARARTQLTQYTNTVNPTAALGRQVADLERRRTSLQTQFQEIQDQLKRAQLGQLVESNENAEHFAMIRSPFPASQPYSPNRIGIILLGVVLAGALAAAAVAIAETSDATVRGVNDIVGLGSLAVLGTVPEILLPSDRMRKRVIWGSVSALYAVAIVIVFLTVEQAQAKIHQSEQSQNQGGS